MTGSAKSALGAAGERHARAVLEGRGWRFVEANWRCTAGEIDLVMADGDELVFVEVKMRRGEGSGRAEDAVSPAKAARLLATGEWYVSEHPEWQDTIWRIDLMAITLGPGGGLLRVSHIENAVVTN